MRIIKCSIVLMLNTYYRELNVIGFDSRPQSLSLKISVQYINQLCVYVQ